MRGLALAPAFACAWAFAAAVPARAAADSLTVSPTDTRSSPTDTLASPTDTLASLPFVLVPERTYGRFGVRAGELTTPEGIAIDPRGQVLVADTGNHRVVRFDSTGVTLGEFGGFGYDPGRFDRPTDLFVGGTLNIWVLDRGNARIVKYDIEGRFIGVIVDLESDPVRARLGLIQPTGFSSDQGGELYVADRAGDRVIVFDPLGAVLDVRGGFGTQGGRFHDPTGVAVDARARLLVADGGNARVQLLDSFGGAMGSFALAEGMTGREGLSVAFGPGGTWALADRATGRLAWWDARGRLLARYAPSGKKDLWAGSVAFDGGGRLYLSDPRAHRVVRMLARPAGP
ncbi:MAG: NHL repeat-containing protein [Candidatus Eiseniibacteriota bacterium]